MSTNNNTPRLRFPEFSGEWEERKLKDCFEERNEQFPENEEYPLMAFIAEKGVAPKGERFDRSALVKDATSKKYKRTEYGDFIYSSNNLESGSIGLNTYGRACISPVYSIFKSKDNVNSTFIGTLLTQKSFISKMVKFRQGVVYGQWKIPEKEFLGIKVAIPTPAEQQKIAECLTAMDNLITAQAQKVDALKEKKKGLMQQLFPQPGQTTPQLRFPGFEGEWVEKKLGDVANIQNGYAYNSCTFANDGDYVIRISDIQDGKISLISAVHSSTIVPEAYKVVKGDILIAMSGATTGKIGEYRNDEVAYINQRVGNIKPLSICRKLLLFILQSDSFTIYLNKILAAGAQPNISAQQINSFVFMLSQSDAEQQKIAECLTALDEQIAAESAMVDALKNHKKGLMQQLFPQTSK